MWVGVSGRGNGQHSNNSVSPYPPDAHKPSITIVGADGLLHVRHERDLHVPEAAALAGRADPRQVGLLRVGGDACRFMCNWTKTIVTISVFVWNPRVFALEKTNNVPMTLAPISSKRLAASENAMISVGHTYLGDKD